MVCTVAAIVYLLGYMPSRGTVITVPRVHAEKYSIAQQAKAIRCARRYGIELREGD
jgi:hypothetical protein